MCDQISVQISERTTSQICRCELSARICFRRQAMVDVSSQTRVFYRSWLSFNRGASTSEINELHSLIIHRWCFHVLNVLPPRLHPLSISVWLFKNRRSLLFCDVTAPRDSDSTKQERKEKLTAPRQSQEKLTTRRTQRQAVFSFKGILINFILFYFFFLNVL